MSDLIGRGCGFAYPPADGTPDREVMDRFADFLRAAGPPARPVRGPDGRNSWAHLPLRSPAQRYHLRFLAWRMEQVQA